MEIPFFKALHSQLTLRGLNYQQNKSKIFLYLLPSILPSQHSIRWLQIAWFAYIVQPRELLKHSPPSLCVLIGPSVIILHTPDTIHITTQHSSWYLGLVKWIHHLYNAHIDQTEHTQSAFTVCINFSKKVVSSLITSLRSGVDCKLHLRWPWRDRALSAWNQTPGLFYLPSQSKTVRSHLDSFGVQESENIKLNIWSSCWLAAHRAMPPTLRRRGS